MTIEHQPLLDWLRRQRATNAIQQSLMSEHFDLAGALAAGQDALAWRARERMLVLAVQLYLRARDVGYPAGSDRVEQARACMAALVGVAPALGERLWDLLLRPAPADGDALAREVDEALREIRDGLGVAAVSREEAVRAWADGVKLLREVARGLGIAESDGWYLRDHTRPGDQLNWYDEVLKTLERHD